MTVEITAESLKPTLDNVLVMRDKSAKISDGGIHLVNPNTRTPRWDDASAQRVRVHSERDYELEGVVVAVGPGKFDKRGNRIPIGITRGERVVFLDDGDDIADGFVMLKAEHILGVRESAA